MMENVRNEEKISGSLSGPSSKQSSLDREISVPSYNVHLVRQLRTKIRISTATIARISCYSYQTKSFSSESLSSIASQSSSSESMTSSISESPRTSPVNGSKYHYQPSLVSPKAMTSRRQRKIGIIQSRDSVLQWLTSPTVDSNKDMSSVPKKISLSGSEASDVDSYSLDDHMVVT